MGNRMRVFYVLYHDHYSERIGPTEKPSGCINDAIGFVVEETVTSITLRHARGDIGGSDEDWEVMTVRKAQIITLRLVGEIEI